MIAWRGPSITKTGSPKKLYLLIITTIILFLATQTINPILPLYITERGVSAFELGIIISLLSFVAIIAKIPLGIMAERVGRWPIIPIVAIGQTISLALYSIAADPSWFYPIRIFHAIFVAAYAPTALAITQDLSPQDKKGTMMGIFLTSIGVTSTFGPFLCTFFVSFLAYEQVFQIVSIIPLLSLIPFLMIIRDKDSFNVNHRRTDLNLRESLKVITSSRGIQVLSYLRLVFSFANAFFITFFAIHVEENLILSSSFIALLFGIKGIANMISRIPSGKLADKIGHKYPIIIAFIILAVAFLVFSETSNIYLLTFALIIYGAAHGMRAVAEWSLLGDYAPPDARNVATAYLSTIFNVGSAFGAVVAGIFAIFLGIPAAFKLAAAIILSGPIIIKLYTWRVGGLRLHRNASDTK
ncbi:MAG: MFS transporter [Candidatus Bathyarchaeota archaeon]|nr:MAG: MFS transporter [Candidatus Bathyarchaeota archaeon]